jgi:hypothetical protein
MNRHSSQKRMRVASGMNEHIGSRAAEAISVIQYAGLIGRALTQQMRTTGRPQRSTQR